MMRYLKQKLTKMMAGILMISMLIQSISMPVMASEVTAKVPSGSGEMIAAISGNEVIQETSDESRITSQVVNELSGNTVGNYDFFNLSWGQFYVNFEFNYYPNNSEQNGHSSIFMEQYDSENQLVSTYDLGVYEHTTEFCTLYNSVPICENTSTIRFKAIENDAQDQIYVSQEFERELRTTQPTFQIGTLSTGAASVTVPWSVTNFGANSEGSSEQIMVSMNLLDEENNEKTIVGSMFVSRYDITGRLMLGSLSDNTTYHGSMRIYVEDVEGEVLFEQNIPVPEFTTTSNETYIFSQIIPDEALRNLIIENGSIQKDAQTITKEQLENIEYLNLAKDSTISQSIESLDGIEYLTSLEQLVLGNHDISDISTIEWNKLKFLRYIELTSNNINTASDFSGASSLNELNLCGNMLTASMIQQIRNTLPRNCSFYASNQRTNGYVLIAEDTYYKVNDMVPIIVLLEGVKGVVGEHKVEFSIDDTKVHFVSDNSFNSKWIYQSKDLSEGAHTLSVSIDGSTVSKQFSVKSQDVFYNKKIVESNSNYISLRIASILSDNSIYEDFDEAKLVLSSDESVEVAYLNDYYWNEDYSDERYKVIGKGSSYNLENLYCIYNHTYFFESVYDVLPSGNYDLQLVSGNTITVLEDVMEVSTNKPVLESVYGASDYNGSGDYIYLDMSGVYLDPSKLDYTVTCDGAPLSVQYVSSKMSYDGYIVKLKRNNWSYLKNEELRVSISAKDGYDVIIQESSCSVYPLSGIFYKAVDIEHSNVELAYTSDYSPSEVRVQVNKLEDNDMDKGTAFASGKTTTIQDGFVKIPLLDDAGKTPKFEDCYYQYLIYFDNQLVNQFKEYGIYSNNDETSWYFESGDTVLEGNPSSVFQCQSILKYEDYDTVSEQNALSGKLVLSDNQVIQNIDLDFDDLDGKLMIMGSVSTNELLPGSYTIQILENENKITSYEFNVVSNDKFYLASEWLSWNEETVIQLGLETPNTSETDDYTIEVFDPKGNPVPNLTVTLDSKYLNTIYYNITGIDKANAYRKYWVKVTHKTLGEPYSQGNGKSYYDNVKGEYLSLNNSVSSSYIYTTTNGTRTVGFLCDLSNLPITINAYIPYDTDPVATMSATKINDAGNVLFTQTFMNMLPNKDRLYDLVVTDKTGKSFVFSKLCIGLDTSQIKKVPLTAISISPKTANLKLKQTQPLKISYTPADASNIKAVTWKSSNSNVASVSTTGTVTGVSVGCATITATCGVFTSTCKVTVTDQVKTVKATPSPLGGAIDKQETVTLTSATPSAIIYYTLDGSEPSNKSSVYKAPITISKAMTIKAKAYKSGYEASETATFTYDLKTYTISFDANGGTNAPQEQVLYKGDYLDTSLITKPVKEGYSFAGWYAGESMLNLLDPVRSSQTYVARWEEAAILSAPTANYPSNKTLLDQSLVKLSTQEADTVIYYTLDESEPTKDSLRYQDQICIQKLAPGTQVLTIKAIATKEGFKKSGIATFTYILEDNVDLLGEILPQDIPEAFIPSQMWIAGLEESYEYTGTAIKPVVRVYYKNRLLTLNKDYTILYENNKNVGAAKAIVKGKSNYTGTYFEHFNITKKPLTSVDIVATSPLVVENGKVIKSIPTLKDNGKNMVYNKYGKKDYTVSYNDASSYKEPGKYEITVTGTNNYSGSIKVVETILDKAYQRLMSKTSVSKIAKQTYTGIEITPAITVKYGSTTLVKDEDYTLEYKNNLAVGTASVTIKGKGDYFGSKTVNFTIQGKDMRYVKVTNGWVNSFLYVPGKTSYTQAPLTLSYQTSTKVPVEVVSDNAYRVLYIKNQGVGTATVIFTGIKEQGYSGSIKKTFKILPNQEIANADVNYNDVAIYRKAGAKPSVSVSLNDVILQEGKDYSVSYVNNKAVCLDKASTKAPTIIISGKGNYRGTKKVFFTIQKAPMSALTMTAKDRVYTQ